MNRRVPTGGRTKTRTTRRTSPTTFSCVIGVFASRARSRRARAVAGLSCAVPPTSPLRIGHGRGDLVLHVPPGDLAGERPDLDIRDFGLALRRVPVGVP